MFQTAFFGFWWMLLLQGFQGFSRLLFKSFHFFPFIIYLCFCKILKMPNVPTAVLISVCTELIAKDHVYCWRADQKSSFFFFAYEANKSINFLTWATHNKWFLDFNDFSINISRRSHFEIPKQWKHFEKIEWMHHNVYIWTIININSLNILKNVLIERNGKHEFAQNILVAFENLKNGWKKKYENKWITNEHRITKKNFVIFSSYVCDGI